MLELWRSLTLGLAAAWEWGDASCCWDSEKDLVSFLPRARAVAGTLAPCRRGFLSSKLSQSSSALLHKHTLMDAAFGTPRVWVGLTECPLCSTKLVPGSSSHPHSGLKMKG